MEITEQAIQLLAKVATEVQARFTNFSDLAHGFEHVHRVYHLAMHLAEQEGVGDVNGRDPVPRPARAALVAEVQPERLRP